MLRQAMVLRVEVHIPGLERIHQRGNTAIRVSFAQIVRIGDFQPADDRRMRDIRHVDFASAFILPLVPVAHGNGGHIVGLPAFTESRCINDIHEAPAIRAAVIAIGQTAPEFPGAGDARGARGANGLPKPLRLPQILGPAQVVLAFEAAGITDGVGARESPRNTSPLNV